MKQKRLMYALPLAALLASAAVSSTAWSAGDTTKSTDPGYGTRSDMSHPSDRGTSKRSDKSADSGTAMKDAAITAKVKSALLAERDLPSTDIKVETNNGIVQLSGFVNSQDEADRAVSVASTVENVKSVENSIQTKDKHGSQGGMMNR